MSAIEEIRAREVLDSRGNPTIEVEVLLESGARGRAIVPSGASTGTREAIELRDQEPNRFLGKGVRKAIDHVHHRIAPQLLGTEALDQRLIDRTLVNLDGTDNKRTLGANALLGVSLSVAHSSAEEVGLSLFRFLGGLRSVLLPVPLMNVLNGGVHADNGLAIQEFMIAPAGFTSFSEALRAGVEVFHHLKQVLTKAGHNTNQGDEGGFAPSVDETRAALDLLMEGITAAGYEPGKQIWLALDAAASEFYTDSQYRLPEKGDAGLNAEAMTRFYGELLDQYPICSIEDGLAEEDWHGWKHLTSELGHRVQLVGDDIFVTNPNLLQKGIRRRIGNAILIKLNQIGTLTETIEAVEIAQRAQYGTVISHRSGETEDCTIADLAVAVGAGQIKTGAPSRSERTAKYNQLLRIEQELRSAAAFAGLGVYPFLQTE